MMVGKRGYAKTKCEAAVFPVQQNDRSIGLVGAVEAASILPNEGRHSPPWKLCGYLPDGTLAPFYICRVHPNHYKQVFKEGQTCMLLGPWGTRIYRGPA